ncbi:hypothetical protein B0H13DRAFT_521741 [Mycena leptocephala]|nr:hypothetical protein B0H13DRAFT_521741 [Mycena leptocephala]
MMPMMPLAAFGTDESTSWHFPPDLELEIFETTAHLYPNSIPRLLRVARRVLSWIEPILYETISIKPLKDKDAKDYALLRIMETKPANFLSHAVRHMQLFAMAWSFLCYRPKTPWSNAELEKVLRACKGVVTLILVGGSDKPEVFTMIADMRPKRLYLIVDMMLDLTVPFFRNTSHLFFADLNHEVESTSTQSEWPQLRNLPCLPALTHLALDHRIFPHTLSTILSDCSHLQTLIYTEAKPLPNIFHSMINVW